MTDWKAIAKARGLDLPPADLDRLASVLNQMDQVFRPLVKGLTPEIEPATEFHIPEDE
jgi:hypothetical protein